MSGTDDEIPPPLRAMLEALSSLGVPVSVQIVRFPRPEAAAPAAPAHSCPLPHSECPACKGELCFGKDNDCDETGVCSHCASIIASVREPLPRAVRALTDEEVMALPDSDRILLLHAQKRVLDRVQSKVRH